MAQVCTFVSGNELISFTFTDCHAAYGWMANTLRQFGYARCKRSDKGVLRRHLCKATGPDRPRPISLNVSRLPVTTASTAANKRAKRFA